MDKVTFTLAEVAEMTGFALRTLERGCRGGRIAHTQFGRARVMTREQIDALIAQHTQTPQATSAMTAKDADRHRALARLSRGVAASP